MRFIWTDAAVGQLGGHGLHTALAGLREALDGVLAPFVLDPHDARRKMVTDADGYNLYAVIIPIEHGLPRAPSFDPDEDGIWRPPAELVVIYQKLTRDDRSVNRYGSSRHPEAVGVVRAIMLPEELFSPSRATSTV